jgi:heme exporter protein A
VAPQVTGLLAKERLGYKANVGVTIAAIELMEVTRLFGSTCALRSVSARFEAGSVTFLTGDNGAGKSTLLSVIGTVLKPTSGSVDYQPLGRDPEAARRHIGWLAHESRCYRDLTGRQNLELAARFYGMSVAEACDRVAELVGLGRYAHRSLSTLSRGQRQRIALARALIHEPSVLLLDEPWSGLDRASSERLEHVLDAERGRGTLIVVVFHDAGVVQRFGGRELRLEHGRVARSG